MAERFCCDGGCNENQGRGTCPGKRRFDGTTRDTQPGELLPNPPDPAVGHPAHWWAFGLTAAAAMAGAVLVPALRGAL